jgi:hypothetical protein
MSRRMLESIRGGFEQYAPMKRIFEIAGKVTPKQACKDCGFCAMRDGFSW